MMSKPARRYGRSTRTKPVAEQLFAELSRSPLKEKEINIRTKLGDSMETITDKLDSVTLDERKPRSRDRELVIEIRPVKPRTRTRTSKVQPDENLVRPVDGPKTNPLDHTPSKDPPVVRDELVKSRTRTGTRRAAQSGEKSNSVDLLTRAIDAITLEEVQSANDDENVVVANERAKHRRSTPRSQPGEVPAKPRQATQEPQTEVISEQSVHSSEQSFADTTLLTPTGLRILTWEEVCPFTSTITKIAEASYAEVYRVTNPLGTSIIKCIRLTSPIRPLTKTQLASGLVDEEPHPETSLSNELQISEWLADIPGFVVYKERYIVQGKSTKQLLETHQGFQRRMKRKDPGRAQFYPSPSRYLEETRFLVVELGDAGVALEDFELGGTEQVWDVFLLTAVALARAEDLVRFEHRDLHEGNLCVRRVGKPRMRAGSETCRFGYSGLDITILDYGLSRAEDEDEAPVAYDLEKDLSIFTSTHAPQCRVYRQMRSFLLKGDRIWLPPKSHNKPYESDFDGQPIDWQEYNSYTNVLWLAYIYSYLVDNFNGEKKSLTAFKKETKEMWMHLDPEAPRSVLSFGSAGDVVRFAVEAGWVREEQLIDDDDESYVDGGSIIGISTSEHGLVRRSARTRGTGLN
jgi:serine/threonine-protein kinase haspin